ncbi:MAG: UDP-N-acetylmuramate dehydrogenase [Nitrospirae bacterium]|nr:UDP-N-acetylmuramate dehydrogenase [Nitrospirota bacterium]
MQVNEASWRELLRGKYQGHIGFNAPMRDFTVLGIGGPADIFMTPDDPLSLRNLLALLKEKKVPSMALGKGSNILVRDGGIEGVVISMNAFGRIEVLKESDDHAELFVEAGVPLQRLVNFCRERGYSGIEGLAGIPGTVGGALFGNAGSYGSEIKDVVASVAIMDADGRLDRYKAEGLGFRYRGSDILPTDIILSANLRFLKDEKDRVSERTERFMKEKIQSQPISERSAGCVFKNPEGQSAGRLIDEAGLKGMRAGAIEVSRVHANFFVNNGGGTASDYLDLMGRVAAIIEKKSGLTLQPEIRVLGRP